MKKFYIILLLCLAAPYCALAQLEANTWYFTFNSGFDFSCGKPVWRDFKGSSLAQNSKRGCASICDSLGNLLFYVQCNRVFNRDLELMPNALLSPDTTMQAYAGYVVTPVPGEPEKYYIFFLDRYKNTTWEGSHLSYAILDMRLDNGKGDVTQVVHNLCNMRNHAIYGTRSRNREEYWIIGHTRNNGIGTDMDSLVVVNVGKKGVTFRRRPMFLNYKEAGIPENFHGPARIRISRDGTLLGVLESSARPVNRLMLYDFDDENGTVTLKVMMGVPRDSYAWDFSPDNRFIYLNRNLGYNCDVIQYDISSFDSATISRKGAILYHNDFDGYDDAFCGPDNRIYMTRWNSSYPWVVIDKPNEKGEDCGMYLSNIRPQSATFFKDQVSRFVTRKPWWGPFEIEGRCVRDTVAFAAWLNYKSREFRWRFRHLPTGRTDTAYGRDAKLVFYQPGRYLIQLIADDPHGRPDTFSRSWCLDPTPDPLENPNIRLCAGDSVLLDPGNDNIEVKWQDGAPQRNRWVSRSGDYIFKKGGNECSILDTFHVRDMDQNARINLRADTAVCEGTEVEINAGYPDAIWNTGAAGRSVRVSAPGIYYAKIGQGNCTVYSDTFRLTTYPAPSVEIVSEPMECGQMTQKLEATLCTDCSIRWSTGETGTTITVSQSGKYWAEANKGGCSAADTVRVNFMDEPMVLLAPKEVFCPEDSALKLDAGIADSYYWVHSGDTSRYITIAEPGIYEVILRNHNGCERSQTVNVEISCDFDIFLPAAFTPDGNGLNDLLQPHLPEVTHISFSVFNRWGEKVFETHDPNKGWDGRFRGKEAPEGIYLYYVEAKGKFGTKTWEKSKKGTVYLFRQP